jgi:hypothetical protein
MRIVRKGTYLAAAVVVITALAACGSSHHAQTYSGHLYSVARVRKAFASLGIELNRGPGQVSGQAILYNDPHHGRPAPMPSGALTVAVITRRRGLVSPPSSHEGLHRVMQYANVAVYSKSISDEIKGAVSALRWGTDEPEKPGKRRIVLGDSIGGIRLNESRKEVQRALGPGKPGPLGSTRYFGGRLVVGYEFHDGIYNFVTYLEARGPGYRVSGSGIHVGSPRQDLRRLYVSCYSKGKACILEAGPWPDPAGTDFSVRHGKVVSITVGPLA